MDVSNQFHEVANAVTEFVDESEDLLSDIDKELAKLENLIDVASGSNGVMIPGGREERELRRNMGRLYDSTTSCRRSREQLDNAIRDMM